MMSTWWPSQSARLCIIYDVVVRAGGRNNPKHYYEMATLDWDKRHQGEASIIAGEDGTGGKQVYLPKFELDVINRQRHSAWKKYLELKVLPEHCHRSTPDEEEEDAYKDKVWAFEWKDPQLRGRLGEDIQLYIISEQIDDDDMHSEKQVHRDSNDLDIAMLILRLYQMK
jgi:hypothetical protein